MTAGRRPVKPQAPAGKLEGAPWFDLRHYRDVPTWTRAEWFRAIACRHFIKALPTHGLPHHWDAIAKDCVRASGLHLIVDDPLKYIRHRNEVVDSIATVELDEDDEDKMLEKLRDGLRVDEIRVAAIDVLRPDMEIKRDFARWLKRQRKRRGVIPEPFTRTDMKRWSKYRVIPYIDIMQFASATGRVFKPAEIQRALFADDEGIKDKGRVPKDIFWQSTRYHAKNLLTEGVLAAISAQFGYALPD